MTTETMPNMKDICVKCHRSWERLMLLALLEDLGASVMPSPLDCDHEFLVKGDALDE